MQFHWSSSNERKISKISNQLITPIVQVIKVRWKKKTQGKIEIKPNVTN